MNEYKRVVIPESIVDGRDIEYLLKSGGAYMSDLAASLQMEMIVTVVNKGISSDVIDSAKSAGAEGATVLHGRGSGVHENAKFFGIVIEPEKEIVIILVNTKIRDAVLQAISDGIEIEKPGHGIAFVIDIIKAIGMPHLNK